MSRATNLLLTRGPWALGLSLSGLLGLAGCSDQKVGAFNTPPEAQIMSPADGATVLSGTPLTLRGAASDANDPTADLSAHWFVDDVEACAPATPADDGTTSCDITVPDAAMDIRLEVTDPDGAAATANISLGVTPNAAPTATIANGCARRWRTSGKTGGSAMCCSPGRRACWPPAPWPP